MVPDKFNMIDMEGIDIIYSQGETVDGLYQKLVESIAQCRYQCLYNWKFDGILIPPTYVEMEIIDNVVWINNGVSVDEEDVIHIYSIEPEPIPEPSYARIEPVFYGLATAYQATDGSFFTEPTGHQCLNIYEIEAGNYVVFLPETVSNRFRAGLWEGMEYSDFQEYLSGQTETRQIYRGSDVITGVNTELSGVGLTRRFFFTAESDGVLIVGTSNSSILVESILLKNNS